MFNPPYVPTDESELGRCDIYAAWAGGKNGRQVIDQFLPKVFSLLSTGGCFYLHVIKENRPSDIVEILRNFGLKFKGVLLQRRANNELLHVLKFVKSGSLSSNHDWK
eukprot:TRINITY_DN2541_c0_g1_i28.p1 TRINITY_DN2541_c0_g1~~TRINITY_DN2541_c0_g1_i28.p1  ORF type:complete len:107 (-),score=14.29 TRINITY_DN2541_c0_g1_i28:120-440(-)